MVPNWSENCLWMCQSPHLASSHRTPGAHTHAHWMCGEWSRLQIIWPRRALVSRLAVSWGELKSPSNVCLMKVQHQPAWVSAVMHWKWMKGGLSDYISSEIYPLLSQFLWLARGTRMPPKRWPQWYFDMDEPHVQAMFTQLMGKNFDTPLTVSAYNH